MSAHFNRLTPAELERLAKLNEELGEAIQVIGKILIHGYESFHPDRPETTNRIELEKELGDVRAAIDFMIQADDLELDQLDRYQDRKLGLLLEGKCYLHHQEIADDTTD